MHSAWHFGKCAYISSHGMHTSVTTIALLCVVYSAWHFGKCAYIKPLWKAVCMAEAVPVVSLRGRAGPLDVNGSVFKS